MGEESPPTGNRSSKRGGQPKLPAPFSVESTSNLLEFDLVTLLQGDDCLLPIAALTRSFGLLPAGFPKEIGGIHLGHLDLEQFLDGLFDLDGIRTRVNAQRELVVLIGQDRSLFGDPDVFDDVESCERHKVPYFFARRSST